MLEDKKQNRDTSKEVEVLEKPWIYLIVDFITKLLLVARKDVILVVYNKLSKIAYFVVMTKKIYSEEVDREIYKIIYS